jgi:hypothetical protein
MTHRHPILVIAALAAFCSTARAQQSADVLKGRVVNDSGKVVIGATVIVTRGPDRATQQVKSDSAGDWTVRFDPGTGDYLVFIAFPGLKSARRRVQSENGEHNLTANFTLSTDVAQLEAMKTTAVKPVRASNGINPTTPETGASEKWSDGVSGQLPPTVAGDLTALASTFSGVTMTGAGASILGSGPTSNLTTLNGMGMAAGTIPRAARTETRVTGATFDATRGGFAGSNIDVRLGPGSRSYQRRNAFMTFDPPQLQFADPTARQLGVVGGGFRGSFGADGELIRRALTYNVALDVTRSASDPVTLVNAEADALIRAGASPDSVAKLLAFAASPTVNLPLTGGSIPDNRLRQEVAWLGRFDDTRDTLQTRALSTYVGYKKEGALGFGALAAPSAAGERRERTLGAQFTHGMFIRNRVLTETRASVSTTNTDVDPYRSIPGAVVLLRSDNGGTDAHDVAPISLGGSTIGSADDGWTGELGNETIWNAIGRRHRFKATVWGRADGIRREGSGNALGTFTFNSLDDFAANHPSSFSRVLEQPVREGTTWNAATAFSHQYAPTRFFSLLYGARVEANGYASAPSKNPALESALGVTSGAAPTQWHVSPRVGFSYTYNRDRDNGSGTSINGVGKYYRSVVGVLRGGIGDFRDILRPDMLADASASTGLAGGTSILSCVGNATPVPDWNGFDAGSTPVPSSCLGGGGVLAESAPAVTLIDPKFDVPHSWRASLDWTTSVKNWVIKIGGLGSYDLNQPGIVDANFSGTPQFSLASEGNRPVYVSTGSIDPNSGAVSAAESRLSPDFGRVTTRVSDLRGYGGQLTLGLSPDAFKFRSKIQLFTSFNYTLQSTKREFRGFDGAGFGDPREREWAAGPNDARHVVVISGGMSTPKTGTITLFARAQSGLPFTPIVQGDVNGDGRSGDRAFIPFIGAFDGAPSDPAFTSQLNDLLTNGSNTAVECIRGNANGIAKRNSCRGPWTNSLNIQWRPPVPRKYVRRVTPNVYLQNVLAGLDQLVHSSDNLRGWGSPASPDPVFLVPRSFDAGARKFTYDINSRFADTRPGRTVLSNPFRLVIDFSMDLSTDYELQQLRRAVEPVKGPNGWQRRTADSLTSFYLGNTSSIHKMLIAEADSLFLSKAQVAALRKADSVYSAQVRAVYGPLGLYLAAGQGDASKASVDSASAAHKRYWEIFWKQPEIAAEIVNPTQRDLIPMFKSMLAVPQEDRKNSQWQFGYPVQIVDRPGMPIR